MNRRQRRHRDTPPEPGHEEPKKDPSELLVRPGRTPDGFDVRAKGTGHKKKTADEWNQ